MPHSGCIIMQCYSHIPSPGLTFYQQCIIRGVFSLAYCAYIPLPSCSLHLLFEQYASTEAHSVNKHCLIGICRIGDRVNTVPRLRPQVIPRKQRSRGDWKEEMWKISLDSECCSAHVQYFITGPLPALYHCCYPISCTPVAFVISYSVGKFGDHWDNSSLVLFFCRKIYTFTV